MFELYTEKARRVIFFARYEASQFGSPYIETEHLLLGMLREGRYFVVACAPEDRKVTIIKTLRRSIEELSSGAPQTSTAVDLPLSNACKRVLAYASEEAERFQSRVIDSEHLFLGLLREDRSTAANILKNHGINLEGARTQLEPPPNTPSTSRDFSPVADVAEGYMVFVDANTNAPIGTIELFEATQSPRIGEIVWIDQAKFTVINVRYEFQRRESARSESTLGIKNIVVLLHRIAQTSVGENTPLSST